MVYIVQSSQGLEAIVQGLNEPGILWLNHGVASQERVLELCSAGWHISTWTSPHDFSNPDEVDVALITVAEHHPNQPIFLEQWPLPNIEWA